MVRTTPITTTHDLGSRYAGCTTNDVDAACTTDSTTTAEIDKRGLSHGTVSNESGASATVTYYAASASGATALVLKDQDGNSVTTTVADDECVELPSAVAGVAFLVPVVASGTPTLTFHFER